VLSPTGSTGEIKPLSVADLTLKIKTLLESAIEACWVEGEISNLTYASSGHVYFTLKDARSQVGCAAWRSKAQSFPLRLENGMKLLCFGSVQVYEPRGQYQLIIDRVIPAGTGMLQLQFEELKRKLSAEGLFDEDKKRPLPMYPNRIGIVTSPTGAVIEDMLRILGERWPVAEVVLYPVKVQGEGSALEIATAIQQFNKFCGLDASERLQVDVMIIGRGGGSLEDLWSFNEEIVVRAVAASEIPIVSAVGHEIDFSLSDFAADVRAPTPTGAAQMVTPSRDETLASLEDQRRSMTGILQRRLRTERQRIEQLMKRSGFRRPIDRLMQLSQRLDDLDRRSMLAFKTILSRSSEKINSLTMRFEALNPLRLLARGFAVVKKSDGTIVRSPKQAQPGTALTILVQEGEIFATTMEQV